jgi:hypothetical protein
MARSVIFFSFIFVLTASLALLLYTFGLSRLLFALLGAGTLFIVYLLFHPRNQLAGS